MSNKQINKLAPALVFCACALPVAAQPASLTGTYEGHFVCDRVISGSAGGFSRQFSAHIRQTGERIDMETFALISPETRGKPSLYAGKLQDSAGGAVVSGYLEACKGRFDYKEMVRIFPATTSGSAFSFAADTIFVSSALPGAEGKLLVESCKWALKRVSSDAPEFETCPD